MDLKTNWDLLAHLASLNDVKNDGFSTIFASIFQAHLPNPDNPPLYADLPAHREGGRVAIDSKLTARLRDSFFLESLVPQYADNLKSLRGFKFDWSRNDGIWDHVFASHALTHKLNEFGLVHEAEEYNGLWDADPYWGAEGCVIADVLPFFEQYWTSSRDEHCDSEKRRMDVRPDPYSDLTAQLSARFVIILESVRSEP